MATPAISARIGRTARRRRLHKVPWVFGVPAVLFYSIFFVFSVIFAFVISFKDWNMIQQPTQAPWTGIENYRHILTDDPLFYKVLGNTLLFAFGTVIGTLVIALVLAFMITRAHGKALWRTIYFLPMVTTVVAVANIWRFLYDPNFGLINDILRTLGLPAGRWLDAPETALVCLIVVSVWSSLGGAILILSAGLEQIPQELYEAARIDGAGVAREFWHITLPMLKPVVLFVLITGFIQGLQSFALALIMTGGGPADSTRVLALYMYETAFQFLRAGRASAMVFVLFVIIFVITLIQLRLFRKGGVEGYY